MVGDELSEFSQDDPDLPRRQGRRRGRAVGLIAVAAIVAVAASVAYLNPTGTSLMGTLAAGHGSPTPAGYQPPGGGLVLPDAVPAPSPTPPTGGFLWRGAVRVVIERFGGLNDKPPSAMIGSVGISDLAVVTSLVTQLNAMPPFPDGSFHCPMDDGSYFELVFTYVDGTRVSVIVQSTGCQVVYLNDFAHTVAWAEAFPNFIATLEGLLTHYPARY
jgi:hypothetical protein